MESWVVFPLAGGEAAGCTLDNSLTNIQWLGKMSSDGLGRCSIKQELEEKENCHLEQNRVKVNCLEVLVALPKAFLCAVSFKHCPSFGGIGE